MRLAVLPETRTFEATGRCIYCGATSDLSREHIIPLSLGGKAILPEGSCGSCRADVGRYEAECLNTTFLQARTFLELPMYDPQYRKTDLRLAAYHGGDEAPDLTDNFRWHSIPVADHPAGILLPVFDEPGIMSGAPLVTSLVSRAMTRVFLNEKPNTPTLPTGEKTMVMTGVRPGSLTRFVAKIAHGAAYAMLGPDAFEPLLTDIIRNRDDHLSHLVGSTATLSPRRRTTLHHVELSLDRGFLVGTVQLFAQFGLAPFIAVVGRPLDQPLYRHWRVRPAPAP